MKKKDAQPVWEMWITFAWPIEFEHKKTYFLKTELGSGIQSTHRVATAGKISPGWWGGGGCTSTHFHYIYHHKFAVYAPAERADTLPRFHLYPYVLCAQEDVRARICKHIWSPGIDSEESISPAYVAWQAGTTYRVVVPTRQAGNRFLGSLKGLQIRAKQQQRHSQTNHLPLSWM
jgi:hypothetical protein